MTAIEDLMRVALEADEWRKAFALRVLRVDAVVAEPDEERKASALRVLRGEAVAVEPGELKRRRPSSGPPMLKMGQAAAFLGVSRSTLWRMIQDGYMPMIELRRNSFRVRREDLEAFLDNAEGKALEDRG